MSSDVYENQMSRFDASTWSDPTARATLQLIAESVAQMVGFEVAVISAVHGDVLVSVAIEGNDDVRSVLGGMRTPMDNIYTELAASEDWGRFKFIDHDRDVPYDEYRWIPDIEQGSEPDSWHPLDALLAPLFDDAGEVRGLLSIDLPLSGRRPDPTQLHLLGRYAEQAERALLNAFERDELAQRLRLAEAAQRVVRVAVSQPDIEAALEECRPVLLEGFRADDLAIRTYPDEYAPRRGSPVIDVEDSVRQLVGKLTRSCWKLQRVGVLTESWHDESLVTDEEYTTLLKALQDLGYASSVIVPIGAGQRVLGHLLLFRKDQEVEWTVDERAGALEVTRDIGQAVLASRNLAREQRLVTELRELDTYKTQLLSTVSHELKNPLSAIAGHLELVAAAHDLPEDTQFSVGAMERATARISRVVDDLLTLSRLEDPERREPAAALDLRHALQAAVESTQFAAEQRSLTIEVIAPPGALPVCADSEGLARVLINLLSNAVKYSRRGGAITVTVTYHEITATRATPPASYSQTHDVEIAIADEGIGISAADQAHLFTEFFRSTNPVALAQPGTGLGLAISARIVRGHGGRIAVDSVPGGGSTFRVFLPIPVQPD